MTKKNKITESTKTPEILSAKSDFIFKLIFGDAKNKDILESFLKSVLEIPDEEYENIEIVDPNTRRTTIDGKLAILDIKVKTKSGHLIDVEIQLINTRQIKERIIFYLASLIHEQLKAGEDYKIIKRAIGIVISDFELLDHDKYFDIFKFHSKLTNTEFSNIMEINTLELPKLPKKSDNTEKWLWGKFIQTDDKEVLKMLAQTSPLMNKAVNILERLSQSDEVRKEYEARQRALSDYNMYINDARYDEKEKIAKNLLSFGVDINIISKSSGLTTKEIESLKN